MVNGSLNHIPRVKQFCCKYSWIEGYCRENLGIKWIRGSGCYFSLLDIKGCRERQVYHSQKNPLIIRCAAHHSTIIISLPYKQTKNKLLESQHKAWADLYEVCIYFAYSSSLVSQDMTFIATTDDFQQILYLGHNSFCWFERSNVIFPLDTQYSCYNSQTPPTNNLYTTSSLWIPLYSIPVQSSPAPVPA